jgi:hydroxymethylbilane synthase
MKIKIAARASNLSKAQVKEFDQLLLNKNIDLELTPIFIPSYGDLDHSISLRNTQYDDLFTKEIDQLVLNKKADLALHSAKDLPLNLHPDLAVFFESKSIHTQDALVFKQGYTLQTIPQFGIILASSIRREEMILNLRKDLVCQDVRGTIEQRLAFLNKPEVFGVVIAEAALIRLDLQSLDKMMLDGKTHPKQGKLAAVGLKENQILQEILSQLHA